MTENIVESAIEQHREFLEERIDPFSGLLDKLLASGTLSRREHSEVKNKSSCYERNSVLLDYILTKHQSDHLITALLDAEQPHIANYLNANGEYKPEFGGEWPLTENEISILDTNQGRLVELLELSDLLGRLYSSGVINKRQMVSISSKSDPFEKNEALIDILRRGSLRDYRLTITCLHHSKQSHIADILEKGGVVVRVHANLEGENVTETENELSTAIANILSDRSIEEANRIFELAQLKVIAAKTGKSIVLYIYCRTIEELQQMHESLTSGRLKESVELWFNRLCVRSQKVTVSALTLSIEEFQKMRTYFKEEEIGQPAQKGRHSGYLEETEQRSESKVSATEYKDEFGGEWPLTENEISILGTNHESLVDLLECGELLGLLYSVKVINKRQMDLVSSKPTSHEKNDALLETLRRRSLRDYKQTIKCLRQTKQGHIAEILEKGGAVVRVRVELAGGDVDQTEDEIITSFTALFRTKPAEERSRILAKLNLINIKKEHSVILYFYCKTLTELIDLREMQFTGELNTVIERLFNQILSTVQCSEVTVDNLKSVVESSFTQLLHRSQIANLSVTLSESEYKKCRSFFPDDIKVRAVVDFHPKKMSSREKNELKDILQLERDRRKTLEYGEELALKDNYLEDKMDLYAEALSFERGDKMKTIPPANIGDSVGWWMVKHLDSGQIGFIPRNRVVTDLAAANQPVKTTIYKLPLELLDVILQKSYLNHALSGKQSTDKKDEFLLNRLSSVDFCWFQRLNKHRFKKTIRRHLSKLYEEFRKGIVIFRSNRSYLEENIQPNGLIGRLRSADCLTDVETRLLSRRTPNQINKKLFRKNNNPDLLHVMRFFDEAKHSDFVRCLLKSKQKLIARVAENGGVSLKATISIRVTPKRLDERINDFRDKTKRRSHQMDKLICQLKDDDIEILNCLPDRQTAVWLWCQSQTGLEKIQKLNESNSLLDVFIGLIFPSSSPEINKTTSVSLCREQFKKSCVVCLFIVNFTKRLTLRDNERVSGVTKLRNEIYVLCDPHVILVFEDRNQFYVQKKIGIREMKVPYDIGSSEKENCLYVTDPDKNHIWKITRETDYRHKITKWLTTHYTPHTLSMSSDGQLLVVSWDSSILRIYGSDAKLLRSIELTRDIKRPIHAVETSIGNFIVLHWLLEKEEWKKSRRREKGIWEVTADGQMVIRCFIPSDETQKLKDPCYLSLDSDDRVFVADHNRVSLLDSDLKWNRILCQPTDEDEENVPYTLCYDEEKKQLIVGLYGTEEVYICTLNRK